MVIMIRSVFFNVLGNACLSSYTFHSVLFCYQHFLYVCAANESLRCSITFLDCTSLEVFLQYHIFWGVQSLDYLMMGLCYRWAVQLLGCTFIGLYGHLAMQLLS